MTKPFSVAREDFVNGLVDIINNCGLPPSVIADILVSTHAQIANLAQDQAQKERAEYEKALAEEEKKKEDINRQEELVQKDIAEMEKNARE